MKSEYREEKKKRKENPTPNSYANNYISLAFF